MLFRSDCEVVQKLDDLGLTKLTRMAFAVKEDELPDPESIGLLGTGTQVAAAANCMNLIHQAQRGRGIGLRRLVDQTP